MTVSNEPGQHRQPSPAARAAVNALDAFGTIDRQTAVKLLTYWIRRAELTPDDVKTVIGLYPTTVR